MKTKFICLAFAAILFVGCDNVTTLDNNTQISQQQIENVIPTFASQEEYNEILEKVMSMSPDELAIYEQGKGYKSFGRICDEFYENIDVTQFESIDDIYAYVENHSCYLMFYEAIDGEIYCEKRNYKAPELYLVNQDRQCMIGGELYTNTMYENMENINLSTLKSKILTNSISQSTNVVKSTRGLPEYEIIKNLPVKNSYYRVHIMFSIPKSSPLMVQYDIKNYDRIMGIWFLKKADGNGSISTEVGSASLSKPCLFTWSAVTYDKKELIITRTAANINVSSPYYQNIIINYTSTFKDKYACTINANIHI